ncbi:hypothetical protein [Hymenobacter jejuensis]|uniref:MFS transporter n=1 Tax=Hymenobacter jejuensis TaxID=2502781 RepID=A0A5B8A286_9BACT|nr:hypothetical protein [Hymenobacter jejuensis]QDA61504.1 hypothetical protein FHG12_15985 [Hymenobacter jejuensis]
MKKAFAHIFVFLVNFYTLSLVAGIGAGLYVGTNGPLPYWIAVPLLIGVAVLCGTYQWQRQVFAFRSIGEIVVGNFNKQSLLHQQKLFSFSRIPLFLLVLVTVVINGNLVDGVSEGKALSTAAGVFWLSFFFVVYYAISQFFTKPNILPLSLLVLTFLLFGSVASADATDQAHQGVFMLYQGLGGAWLVLGVLYIWSAKRHAKT